MHDCLEIPDIFAVICRFVGKNPSRGGADLASLALTCRAFSRIATDELWSAVDRIGLLMLALTDDLWNMEQNDGYTKIAGLKREMTLNDLKRLEDGLSRVRELHVAIEDTSPTMLAIKDVLEAASRLGVPHPLPRRLLCLRLVGWAVWNPDIRTREALQSLFVPSILSIVLVTNRRRVRRGILGDLVFRDLAQRCPNLTSIRMEHRHGLTPPYLATCISELSSFKNLYLISDYPSPQLLEVLSKKETFSRLTITSWIREIDLEKAHNDLGAAPTIAGAPYLRHLHMSVYLISETCRLLRSLRTCALETLYLSYSSLPSMEEVRRLLRTLADCLHHLSLRHLRLHRYVTIEQGVDKSLLLKPEVEEDLYDLQALSAFTNLETLDIQIRAETAVGLLALQNLAGASNLNPESASAPRGLSNLTTLKIGDKESMHAPASSSGLIHPVVKLNQLPAICALFPKLQELGLFIDAGDTAFGCASGLDKAIGADTPYEGSTQFPNLQRIHVSRSPIASALDTAAYLAAHFPNISGIGVHAYSPQLCVPDWHLQGGDEIKPPINPGYGRWIDVANIIGARILESR